MSRAGIERRLKRLEESVGVEDKIITLDFGGGVVFTMKESELTALLAEIADQRRNVLNEQPRSRKQASGE